MSMRGRQVALVAGASLVFCAAAYGVGRSVKETTRVTPAATPSEIVIESDAVLVPPQGPSLPRLPRDPTATPTRTPLPSTDQPTTDVATTDAPTTDAPSTDASTTDAPTTDAPTTDAPPSTDFVVDQPPETDSRPSTDVTDQPPTDIIGSGD